MLKDVPSRHAPHDRRMKREYDPAYARRPYDERTHGARFDCGIDRAVAKRLFREGLPGLRDRYDLGVARFVGLTDRVVDTLCDNDPSQSYQATERILSLGRATLRQLNTPSHHSLIYRNEIHVSNGLCKWRHDRGRGRRRHPTYLIPKSNPEVRITLLTKPRDQSPLRISIKGSRSAAAWYALCRPQIEDLPRSDEVRQGSDA